MERCVGNIKGFASGEDLKNGKGGTFMVARGGFSMKPGQGIVSLSLEPRTIRSLKKQARLKTIFTVKTKQATGATTARKVRRNIH